jgi:mRNA-degrading endonuclease toxin of MazEF toxin-antitoxin module
LPDDPETTRVIPGRDDGMPDACALSLDDVTTLLCELFRERITRLSVGRMNEVCRALALATGCA